MPHIQLTEFAGLLMWCLQDSLDRIAPEGPHYRHADEGSDDMPAHVKVCGHATTMLPSCSPYLAVMDRTHLQQHAVVHLQECLASLHIETVHVLCSLL